MARTAAPYLGSQSHEVLGLAHTGHQKAHAAAAALQHALHLQDLIRALHQSGFRLRV